MATLKKYDLEGKQIGELSIEDNMLAIAANPQMIKDYLVAIRYNARQWNASTKTRREVNATGKKPRPQKGTGQARQGCFAAPQFKGGGRVFGPRPKEDMNRRINRKEKRLAVAHLLAEKIKAGQANVLGSVEKASGKTKQFAQFLQKIQAEGKRIYLIAETQNDLVGKYDKFVRSIKNIPYVEFTYAPIVNGYDLALCDEILFLEPAMEEIKAILASESGE